VLKVRKDLKVLKEDKVPKVLRDRRVRLEDKVLKV
jgi:hypothetical protein